MAAMFVSAGVTVTSEGFIMPEQFREVLVKYRDVLVENAVAADPAEYLENVEALPGDDWEAFADVLGEAYNALAEDANTFTIPGTGRLFWTKGADTWGDSPFDGYDGLIILAEYASLIPEFGQEIGVFGGGIVLP